MKSPSVAIESPVMRALAAVLLAIVLACLIFLMFGILIPALGFRAYYGTEDEADGPGIAGLFLPMGVGVICVAAGCALTKVFYQSWSPRHSDHTGH
jgi:uncharacterized membrane protein YedE/YeeE